MPETVHERTASHSSTGAGWGPEALRHEVSLLLGEELGPADEDVNLFRLGLQSLQLMQLTNRINRSGVQVAFTDLSNDPRLSVWYKLVETAGGASAGDGTADPHEAGRPAPAQAVDTEGEPFGEPFALTPVQQAYWIGRGDEQPLGGVGCHAYLELDAARLDPDRLDSAVRALVTAHPMLRARFEDDGTQRVLSESPWPGLTVHDLTGHTDEDARRALATLRESLSHRKLEVSRGEVLDVQLSRLPEDRQRLHLNVDLLVADVHSIRILLADLAAHYADGAAPPEVAYTFRQYLAERADAWETDRLRAREYWAARLDDLPGGPRLPLATEPEDVPTPRFVRRTHILEPRTWEALREWAAEQRITPAVLLATAFSEVLARWSGEERFLLNVPLFDRDQGAYSDIDRIVADFTSLVLLEVDLAGTGFAEHARALQRQLHRDVGHAAHTGVDVLRDLVRATPDQPRTAPVVFACNLDAPLVPDSCAEQLGELSWMVSQTPQVWLDHQIYGTRAGGVELAWDVVEELFPAGVVDAMFAAYARFLEQLASAGRHDPPTVSLPEDQRRRREGVNSARRTESGLALHHRFFARAAGRGDAPAVLWGRDGELSHAELATRALRIGGALVERGVTRGSVVAVTAPKGPDQIAAVLGILAAGATYVPVGVDQPDERRSRILRLSEARTVLDGQVGGKARTTDPGTEFLPIAEALLAEPLDAPVSTDPEDSAYIIFTSGSTGTPKGVEVTHRAAVNTVEDIDERFAVGPDDRVLAVSALDFDLSVWDVFGPLAEGGALVLVEESDRRDAGQWLKLCARHRVTLWNSVPALLDMLLVATGTRPLPGSLRLALLSGDWVGLDMPRRLATASGGRCRLAALGGATEAGIWSNCYEVEVVPPGWTSVPYGKPLRNQKFRVVDAWGRDCPDWVPGELWIGGTGVALGYRGDQELTVERFPQLTGERWYRTGDIGRYRPDGNLEFLGRIDQQVKINGFRVELGEVEAALQTDPAVAAAVAVTTGSTGHELVAAVVERTPSTVGSPVARTSSGDLRAQHAPQESHVVASEDLEHALVETVLTELCATGLPSDGSPIGEEGLPAGAGQRSLVHRWLAYLAERDVVVRTPGGFTAGPRLPEVAAPGRMALLRRQATGTWLERIAEAVTEAQPLLAAVLGGEAHGAVLLEHPVLSPEALNDAMPGARSCTAEIARALSDHVANRPEPLALAQWDARTGLSTARLLDGLPPGTAECTLLDSSLGLLETAQARLAGLPYPVSTLHQRAGLVLASQLHAYDVVVADNALHRMRSPRTALATMALLLRPGGQLWFVERTRFSPLALLSAVPLALAGGGTGAVRPAEPWLCDTDQWVRACAEAGFTGARVLRTESAGEVLITAERSRDAVGIDPAELTARATDRLPAHMVPARLVALPELPLSGHGKVDRPYVERVLGEVATSRSVPEDPPQGPLEESVAALWARLLGVSAVGRGANFFRLGGDSLLATRLVALIREVHGAELPMREVMRAPTLSGMCALLNAGDGTVTGKAGAGGTDGTTGPDGTVGDIEEGVL